MSATKPPYNLLTQLQKAQATLEHYNVGGTLVIESDQLEAAESAVVLALRALTEAQTLLMTRDWDEPTCLAVAKVFTECGVAIRAKNDDAGLTAQELEAKYSAALGGRSLEELSVLSSVEHPVFTASDWQAAVWDSYTRAGYWDWVVEQIASSTPVPDYEPVRV